jgi:hypothetical protein
MIPRKVGVLKSMGLSLLYESTVNQAGPGHYSHTCGWGDPFHLDSWSHFQWAADQRK